MKLSKALRWVFPLAAGGYLTLQSRPIFAQQGPQPSKIEIKFLSKNEFLSQFVNSQQSHALLIVFEIGHLKISDGQERERHIIELSKAIATELADIPNVKVYLFRKEDYAILDKGLQATSQRDMPFKVNKDKEAYLVFKRADYNGFFDMNEHTPQFTVQSLGNKNNLKELKRSLIRLTSPVKIIRTEKDLKTELIKNMGINDRSIILDICKASDIDQESEKLTQYMLNRFEDKLISPYSTALVIDQSLADSHNTYSRLGVVKNDFTTLHELQSKCKNSLEFRNADPLEAAQLYYEAVKSIALSAMTTSAPNFSSSIDEKEVAIHLDDFIQPEVPLFLYDEPAETLKFYTHIYNSDKKKIMGLNLLKEDPSVDDYAENLMKAFRSGKFTGTLRFQVFADSSQERMLKQLNKYYSPFCIYDLNSSVGKSYQKVFVQYPYMSTYGLFEVNIQSALEKAQNPEYSDKVLYSQDSIESLSSRSFAFYQLKNKAKVQITLLLRPQDKVNLIYEKHMLEKFGHKEHLKLSKLIWPNVAGSGLGQLSYPSLLILPQNSERPLILDLPSHFRSAEHLKEFMSTLDANILRATDM